jgi:hypothetical protein
VELKEFVTETLTQIIDGVKAAQEHAKGVGAAVSPKGLYAPKAGEKSWYAGQNATPVHMIEFDVAVSASSDDKAKGGAGLFVGPVALGAQGETGTSSGTVSRIRFNVPMILPEQ